VSVYECVSIIEHYRGLWLQVPSSGWPAPLMVKHITDTKQQVSKERYSRDLTA